MPIKEKKFISKRNAVTYRLVPRCQVDPTSDSSECVLVPIDEAKHEKFSTKLPAGVLPPPGKQMAELKREIPVKGQPGWDPDIVAALDDDEFSQPDDTASVLEDDFIALANGPIDKFEDHKEFENDSDDDDDNGSLFFDDEDINGRKRAEKYSLTSAVEDCSEDVRMMNEKFERLCETYGEDNIGGLDFENIEGFLSLDDAGAEDYVDSKKKLFPYEGQLDEDIKSKTLQFAESDVEEEESESEEEAEGQLPKYDCESIISTYSTTQNLPTLIKMVKKEKPPKISTNMWKSTITKSNLNKIGRDTEEDVESEEESMLGSHIRKRNETPEEKKQRKQAVKQLRRETRIAKKENKLAFKEEEKKRKAIALNVKRCQVVKLF